MDEPVTSTGLERDAWRLAAEHLELTTLLPALSRLLGDHLGPTAWAIRRFDDALRPIDAVALPDIARPDAPQRTSITLDRDGTILVVEGSFDSALAEACLRPIVPVLQVALANDRRVHELERLREAVEADNRALLSRLQRQDISDSIVGAETGLREVMARVQQVAPTDAPVLILGETGSGKEVVARAIHTRSRRHDGPFLRVNCGAIPPELVDSELFGHERGSFTGAIATRHGWFERADGGTLFLDEVGELPPAAQVRLLRVLQDGAFERVGGSTVLTVDVRIVAATHRDVPSMLAEGGFRQHAAIPDAQARNRVAALSRTLTRDRPVARLARRAGAP